MFMLRMNVLAGQAAAEASKAEAEQWKAAAEHWRAGMPTLTLP